MALPTQTSALRLLIVGAALVGALVVTHLGLQASNDFANGCSGVASAPVTFDPTAPAETSGCETVTTSAYSTFLGVSLTVWGGLFYGFIVVLRLAYAASADDRARLAALVVSAVGVLFAAYLVYVQAAEIGAFCALCLTSHAVTFLLFALHLMEHRRLASATASDSPRRRAPADRRGLATLRPYLPILGVFVLLVGADVALASRSSESQSATATAPPLGLDGRSATPISSAALAGAPGDVAAACQFDPSIAPIADLSPLMTGPFVGSADDDAVTVVEIFDPNCPHCRDLAEVLEPVKAELGDRARFYTVAYPLREQSVAQVMALNIAKGEGKYQELIDEMFRRQDSTWGMNLPELVTTLNAVGMDGAAFQGLIQDQARLAPLLQKVQADAAAVGAAFSSRDGGISTPRVAVGNRVVLGTPQAFTAECFAEFIAQAKAGTAGSAAPGPAAPGPVAPGQ